MCGGREDGVRCGLSQTCCEGALNVSCGDFVFSEMAVVYAHPRGDFFVGLDLNNHEGVSWNVLVSSSGAQPHTKHLRLCAIDRCTSIARSGQLE